MHLRDQDTAGKGAEDNLFDKITPDKVNKHLQTLLSGLTIKVFRTYNATITLSRLLKETDSGESVLEKKKQVRGRVVLACSSSEQFPAQYDEANKEVAILCNHQKGVNKNHDTSMAKLAEKRTALVDELKAASSGPAADKIRCVSAPCMFAAALKHPYAAASGSQSWRRAWSQESR